MLKLLPSIKFFFFTTLLISCFFYTKTMAQPTNSWVESTYEKLTLEQKIGQLFMVAAYSGTDKYNEQEIKTLIQNQQIGGLIFMQGTAERQAELTNEYHKLSNVPLLIAMDAEWGLGMRLRGIDDLPKQMYMGATGDAQLMKRYGNAVADQCKRLGVHVNFAPVIDVNNNPRNPVINDRSFGENKKQVTAMGVAYMKAMQEKGVMACAKHFPGHGDTDVDSHEELPKINKSKTALQEVELFPFRELIKSGVQSMMIAHLNIPALEPNNVPTTLSKKVVTDLLKNEMGFEGLIFTDALNMKGVTKYYKPGEVDYLAFKAGNDVLLFSEDVEKGIQKIREAIVKNEIPMAQLEASVKKILTAKYNAGLANFREVKTQNIDDDINQLTSVIRTQTAQKGITLLSDPYNVLDKIGKKNNKRTAYVVVGATEKTELNAKLQHERLGDIFYAETKTAQQIKTLKNKLEKYEAVIIGVHDMSRFTSQDYGIDFSERKAVTELALNKNTLTVVYGNPYAVSLIDNDGGFMICYDEQDETVETALQILTRTISAYGKLPVSISAMYKAGAGIESRTTMLGEPTSNEDGSQVIAIDKNSEIAQRYYKNKNGEDFVAGVGGEKVVCCVSPMSVGSQTNYLDKVDNLMENAIAQRVFPGCRVMAVKDGKVFYDRSFGNQTYDKKEPVTNNTMYDLASVTKIAATTVAVMKLYEEGKIDLDAQLGKYISQARGTNKENVQIKNLLLHQGGLHAWIPFYKETLDENGYPKSDIYQTRPSALFSKKVSNGLYMNRQWVDTMWQRIYDSEMKNIGRYTYSDLDFIFLQEVVERVSGMSLDRYVEQFFYSPLGMKDTKFNPSTMPSKNPIAPTEEDDYFRHKKVQGYVHDMGAAMFGGVSGHAGLFSTAEDMSVLMQMLLNGGVYNGRRYLKESTVKLFTSRNSFISRRGLGFDKPEPNSSRSQPTSTNCSLATFGHTGFTGTCLWADPVNNIQFIFLSNRTYPSAATNLLSRKNIREEAQQYIYQSLGISSR